MRERRVQKEMFAVAGEGGWRGGEGRRGMMIVAGGGEGSLSADKKAVASAGRGASHTACERGLPFEVADAQPPCFALRVNKQGWGDSWRTPRIVSINGSPPAAASSCGGEGREVQWAKTGEPSARAPKCASWFGPPQCAHRGAHCARAQGMGSP